MNSNNRLITISMNVNDYIALLDTRRENVLEWYGWTIPYDYFIEMLEEGYGVNPEHAHPNYIIDNIAVNGDYTTIEEDNNLLTDFLDTATDYYLKEYDTEPTKDELTNFILEDDSRKSEIIEDSGIRNHIFFTYDEPESIYSIGICYSL